MRRQQLLSSSADGAGAGWGEKGAAQLQLASHQHPPPRGTPYLILSYPIPSFFSKILALFTTFLHFYYHFRLSAPTISPTAICNHISKLITYEERRCR